MLKKLLKYEFKATARTYGTIYLALLFVAGLLGFTFRVENDFTESRVFDVLFTLYDLLAVALVVVTIITVIHRFTRNLLGREGYLMHTLPVTEAQLVGSKLISSVGAFFLMSWGQGRVENLLNAGGFVRILMGSAGDTIVSEAANHSTLIFFAASFAITAVFGAVYFILTCWLMKNKLNLE